MNKTHIFDDQNISQGSSVLNISDFVNWKKSQRMYNFEHLPATAIISLFGMKFGFFKFVKKTKGLTGTNYILEKENVILCTGFGSGAPSIINLCEELRVLGVVDFVFLGIGGSLHTEIEEGELFYIQKAISSSGVSFYYKNDEILSPFNANYGKRLMQILETKELTVWSTDAPFRETDYLVNKFRSQGAKLVEMECAALYAFSNYYQVNVACFVLSADQLIPAWSPPKDIQNLVKIGKATIERIIQII